jgi:hypothetical protein
MKRNKKLLIIVMLSVVVALVLMGATSRKNGLYATSGPRTLTITGSDCTPHTDNIDYFNNGYRLVGAPGIQYVQPFTCAVNFPDYGIHTVTHITLYAYDQHTWADRDVFAKPFLASPKTGSETQMGTVRSTSSSTTDPRAFTISWGQISPNKVYPGQKMHFWVYMEGHSGLAFYGLRITYRVKN